MPEELRGKLADAAGRAGRSLNSEIVDRLEASVRPSLVSRATGWLRLASVVSTGGTMKKRWVGVSLAAVSLVTAAAIIGLVTRSTSSATSQGAAFAVKGDPDARGDKAGIPNEGPSGTYEAEQEALRAYPAESVPVEATQNSIATFASLKQKGKGKGTWVSIGPSQAKYPALLDQFLAGGKEYTASGRVTALALAGCKKNGVCRLYLGAAGGGIWRGDKVKEKGNTNWTYVSGSLGTNAIGALLVDPRDASGNTVYVGTGEPNASGDSEAGTGIYKTTDGGDTWTLVAGSDLFTDRAIGDMTFDKDGNLLIGLASAIRGVSSVTGGAVGCPTPHGCAVRGVYRQNGATWTLLRATNIRGTMEVAVDPNNSNILYQSSFAEGIWRSLDNGATWAQIKPALNPANNADRAEFAVNKLPNGKTRMYVGDGNTSDAGANRARFYRTDDAAGAAVFTDMTTPQNIGYCTAQCWYDNVVYSPPGAPDVVYLGGSYSYGQQHVQSNGRAVLQSIDGGATWSDMTLDSDDSGWLHPDQHALLTLPDEPLQWIAGDDGGVVRANGRYVDASAQCDSRGLNAADTAFCKQMLSRIPEETVVMNKGLATLQFQSFSVDPKNPQNSLMGGTQDNGTFEFKGSSEVWPQIIYGDGGQSGWNAADSTLRFNSFFGQNHDANFQNGDPAKWVIISGKIAGSPEGSNFYAPIIADPNPAAAGSIFEGSQSVWRTQDWGGDQAFLEANCPEFTTAGDNPICGDFVRLGPAGATDLTSAAYGADRAGSFVAAIERAPSNTGTLWAATNTGRVFISENANDPAAASVVWTRLDPSSTVDPARFVSSIYVDPTNPNHAWISYSGYNINTPSTPGHVFEVTRAGATATWVDRTYDLADLPVTDLVRDDVTGDLYAATDFGVMRLAAGATSWTIAADGMPMVEVPGLTIAPGERILYAATHGLGGWQLDLAKLGK
jgi:hypothetical protein